MFVIIQAEGFACKTFANFPMMTCVSSSVADGGHMFSKSPRFYFSVYLTSIQTKSDCFSVVENRAAIQLHT